MKEKIIELSKQIRQFDPQNKQQLEEFKIKFLSKKGMIPSLFQEFKQVPPEERKTIGILLNELKQLAHEHLEASALKFEEIVSQTVQIDTSLPAASITGGRHPISIVSRDINTIFERLGFVIAEGPEIEDDFHNFTALNFPEEHPARDMQDTFFIAKSPDIALRTHTSSVQVRVMEQSQPPIRIIAPGRVFRNEAISARAHCIFHQVEGLYIDKEVSFADLKQTLFYFAREFFGANTKIRFRPSYFPFTETSAEMDVSCNICGGKGCTVCKYSGWVEILGCGMVDPNVLEACNINPEIYSGYAFGMGIERIAMMKYQINDLRLFFENDMRFLSQFSSLV
ncbi:MAG: phenylalanine--tRNA ligase subunit alpha [Bacteroidales bacterium]|jgi:phenylalanyl-tRNA synthetase alpha chain|nr:phenylalanine--tRNA ligase subunit alpha [Bacteroidales bacterium]MDD3701273.1 phenylalanine--tRNA ligase subunit alpha [Bacteroidales bacterium]MDY0368402.1 phenylalanine--tRNA ligase subunit alpha [Bacteroidales bacterium]